MSHNKCPRRRGGQQRAVKHGDNDTRLMCPGNRIKVDLGSCGTGTVSAVIWVMQVAGSDVIVLCHLLADQLICRSLIGEKDIADLAGDSRVKSNCKNLGNSGRGKS